MGLRYQMGWLLGVAALVLLGLFFFWPRADEQVEVATSNPTAIEAEPLDENFEIVGGVRRPRSDVERGDDPKEIEQEKSTSSKPDPYVDGYGLTPSVAIDANPQVAAAAKAFREKTNPERLSPLVQPAAFDLESYRKDPEPYLGSVEPGRVFQPAQPGEGVSELRRRSPQYQQIEQGEVAKLSVKAEPGAPVTFTSFDLGRFANQLTSTTVEADTNGLAVAEFFAPAGTIANVNILAASPLNSGQIKFIVDVSLPQQ